MKNYKNRSRIIFLFLSGIVTSAIGSYDFDSSTIEFQTEEADEFDQFFDESGEMNIDKSMLRSCDPEQANDWIGYLDALQIPQLLDASFYHYTNIPNCRNIINYPNFFIFQPLKNKQLTTYLFYNQAFKKNFAPDKTNFPSRNQRCSYSGQRLGSYLNIEDAGILSFLATQIPIIASILPPGLQSLKNINFPLVLRTLGDGHLEERRLGFLFHYYHEFNPKTILEIRMPFLYEIHNLNFTPQQKRYLSDEFAAFEKDPDFNETEFGLKHFAMDAFGSGTLDLTLEHTCYESGNAKVNLGLALYLPTDRRWVSGVFASYFTPKDIQPILPLCALINGSATETQTIVQDYFIGLLDHLSSAILQCPMGYNQHMAIALKIEPFWQWKENLLYSGMYIFEYITPREDSRFYIYKQGDTPFSTEFASTSGDQAKMSLLEQQLTKTLFPRVFTTKVSPGFVVNTISNLQFTRHAWDYTIGYNWWYRTGEKLTKIQASAEELKKINVYKATAQTAQQVKIYGKIHTVFKTERHDISCAFFGNLTVYNSNLGNDFSLGISFDKTF